MAESEFYGNNSFCLSSDEEGNPCVHAYGTPWMYTPGDQCGHEWDPERHTRYAAPRYEGDATNVAHARKVWVEEAIKACEYFGIA